MGQECAIVTPYLHSHGVYITVYAKQQENGICIHDNGETLQSLLMRGVKIFDAEHREQLLKNICTAYNVENSGWTIQKTVPPELVGEAMIDLINALKSTNDMIYLHSATSSDMFKFEVMKYFKDKRLDVTPDFSVNGKTTVHKIDFYYRHKQRDNFIKVISGSQLQMKVIRAGFTYYDIKETKRDFAWISVINPEDEWTKHSLEILGGFSKTVSWELKERLVTLLN